MSPLERRSALAHRQSLIVTGGAVSLTERPFEGKLILRGKLDTVGKKVAAVLGASLPATAMQTTSSPGAATQWLGPDEWLIVAAPGTEAALLADLGKALAGLHSQVADVTDYYTTIALSGTRARDMLMKITTIDFHPVAFRPGMGVTTNFGRATAWARQTGDTAFDVIVRISMADYLWCLLVEAGREWGLPPQTVRGADVKLHLPHLEAQAHDDATAVGTDLEIA